MKRRRPEPRDANGQEQNPREQSIGHGRAGSLTAANRSAATNRNTGRLRRTKAIVSAIMGS
jgi:hypothetical protein